MALIPDLSNWKRYIFTTPLSTVPKRSLVLTDITAAVAQDHLEEDVEYYQNLVDSIPRDGDLDLHEFDLREGATYETATLQDVKAFQDSEEIIQRAKLIRLWNRDGGRFRILKNTSDGFAWTRPLIRPLPSRTPRWR